MAFQFVEEGKWSKQAEIMKFKVCHATKFFFSSYEQLFLLSTLFWMHCFVLQSQFGEAQAKELRIKQTQLARAKAEPESNPNLIAVGVRIKKEKQKDEIPEIEWW